MATVVFSPGAVTSGANFMQWEDRDPPVGLVDASLLSGDSDPKYIQRIRFWRTVRLDKIYLNAKSTTPDGTSAFSGGDNLNAAWEAYSAALVIRAGGETWTFAGPTHPQNVNTDDLEAYGWTTNSISVNNFITEYEALTAAQQAGTTITLDDGEAVATPLDAAGTLDGGLAGSLDGVASLLSPTPLDAAGTLDGGLAGTLSGAASLEALNPIDAAGTLDGGLAGSLSGAASLGLVNPLDAAGTLDGGLAGSVSGAASLSPLPLDAAGTLTGGLTGSLEADADVVSPPAPDTAMKIWLRGLNLPYGDLDRRWQIMCGVADLMQGIPDNALLAIKEFWPATCSAAMLGVWGEVLGLPRRSGETVAQWRQRLALWRQDPVGTSGWVVDTVKRITGQDPPKVIEFPRQGLRLGYSRLGTARLGGGPSLTVGVASADRAEVEAALEAGVPPDVGITHLTPAVFDAI